MPSDTTPKTRTDARKRLLFLSRIHPKKGLDILLRAWREVDNHEWDLHIVGAQDSRYALSMRRLAEALQLRNVYFHGAAYGKDKEQAFRAADLYVLPTYSENFGISVAEALSYGVPAIVTRGAPWAELQTHHCGWWIEIGIDPLVEALQSAMSADEQDLAQLGHNGRALVEQKYSWDRIAMQMLEVYGWLLGHSVRPECVVVGTRKKAREAAEDHPE